MFLYFLFSRQIFQCLEIVKGNAQCMCEDGVNYNAGLHKGEKKEKLETIVCILTKFGIAKNSQ